MKRSSSKAFLFIGILCFIEIAIIGFTVASIPSDPKNEFIWGISAFRLINLAIIFLLGSLFLGVLLNKKLITRIQKAVCDFLSVYSNWSKSYWGFSLLFFFFFIFLQIPAYQLKDFQLFWERLSPNFLMGGLLAMNGILLLVWVGHQKTYFKKGNRSKRREFVKSFSTFAVMALALVVFVVVTRIGLAHDAIYLHTAGVPILAEQVLLIFFGYLVFIGLRNFLLKKSIKINTWIIFLILWATASLVWITQPIARNYFVYLPEETIGNQFYPKSDAQRFDQGAELMLLGEGVLGGITEEKPFLMVMIAAARVIGGGNYLNAVNVQVILLALIVPGLYLIGKELYSPQFGVALSTIGILYEINTLNSSGLINNVHIKLLMSEPYTLLGMVWITYFFIRWMKNLNALHLGFVTFSLIGFFSFVRANVLGVFLIGFVISLILPQQKFVGNLKRSLAASLALIGINLPWAIYAYTKYGYIVILNKIETVLRTRVIERISFIPIAGKTAKSVLVENSTILSTLSGLNNYLYITAAHFFNNLIKTVLIFPINLRFDRIRTVLDQPYWDETAVWDGSVSFVLFINLIIITAGITALFKRHRAIGLLPLYFALGYYLTLALAHTSGGRYLGPGIWVFYLYYFAGLFSVFETIASYLGWELKIFSAGQSESRISSPKSMFSTILIVSIIGISIPLANEFIPERFEDYPREELIGMLNMSPEFNQIYTQDQTFAQFVDDGKGALFYGEVKYPVRVTDPEDAAQYRYKFSILGPSLSRYSYLISHQARLSFPDGAEVVGFGCRTENADKILFLYLLEEQIFIQSSKTYRDICVDS